MITLYRPDEHDFRTNGIGILDEYIQNDVVKWKDNNEFSFSFTYPIFAPFGLDIKGDYIIKTPTPIGEQLFRIYRPRADNDMLSVECLHITYDLSKNLIEDTFIVDKNGHDALNQMASKTQFKHPFTFSSDIKTINSSRVVRKNPIEFLIDTSLDNSFVNRWGGHLIRDNFHLKMVANPERKEVVTLRDRKNVSGYSSDIDYEPVVTRIMPQGFDGLFLPEKFIDSPLINRYPFPRIQVVEFPEVKAEKEGQLDNEDTVPLPVAYDMLRKKTKECYDKLKFDEPKVSYKIDFIDLRKTEEYKDFQEIETIMPNDRVNFIHDGDLEVTANLVEYTYRSSTEEYLTMGLGNFKPTFSNVMNDVQNVSNQIPIISTDISKIHTDTARGAYGGSVILMNPKDIGQGTSEQPFLQVFMNKNTLKSSDKFLVLNSEGLGFIKGPFDLKKFSASWGIDGVLNLGEGMLKLGTDKLGRFLENTADGLEFFNGKSSIGTIGVSSQEFPSMPNYDESYKKSLAIEINEGEFFKIQTSDNPKEVTGIYVPNPRKFKDTGNDLIITNQGEKNGIIIEGGGAAISIYKKKVNIIAKAGLFLNGKEVFPGQGTGGGNGSGNLGSREDYAKNMITAEFNVDYDKMYASYVKFGRIQAWGLANRETFNELNNIIKSEGVSPVFFWAYEGGEGYNSSLSFLNHFYRDGSSYQNEARRTARWVRETSQLNGSLAWYDAMFPDRYTSPPDKQAVGNAYMADTKPGMIARVMLQGTAAATWAMFDPAALSGSVNGVQDYADPFEHQISLISSWQAPTAYAKPMNDPLWFTSEFGWRTLNGVYEFHNGMDLGNSNDTRIFASSAGEVVFASGDWWSWYGNYVVVKHADGNCTGYAHLSRIDVKVGQTVSQRQQLGLMGTTGPSTGPHLHFQVMTKFPVSSDGDFRNPRDFVKF